MFKIILADDEPIIIKGLRKMISWEELNAEIVAEARNGEELLEKIKEFEPDIVISDVAMPRMTGLDVIKAIRANESNTKVIFLSGYQEFEYVRTAIRYEAVEYLLKPVGKEELEQAVLKAEKMLKTDHPMEYWQEEQNDMQTIFRKMNSESECKELYTHFKDMGIETEEKSFTGVCFSIPASFYKKIGNQNMAELLRFSIFKKIEEALKKEKNGFVIKREANCSNIILLQNTGQEGAVEQEIQDVRNRINKEYKVWLIVGVGNTVNHVSELKFAYKTAKFCSELYYFTEEDIIRYKDISREFHSSFEDYNNKYKEMLDRILSRDDNWNTTLTELLEIVENLHFGNRYAAENRCIAMAMDLFSELEECRMILPDTRKEYDTLVAKIRNQSCFRELKLYIAKFITVFLNKYACNDIGIESNTIRIVKEYIKEHYAEDLNLGKLAEIVYMNPYYFSSFFKKETGENFKNYLAEVRMKAALKLLLESDMKTYELAEAVGYHDVRSFTEKFREYFGESPSSYKKARKS
nr:response regulator [uncultured Blautia sp.]